MSLYAIYWGMSCLTRRNMRTMAIGLLIWLVIMLSACVFCMEESSKPPHLYSEAGVKYQIKKAYKEGYSKGMEESKLVTASLDQQLQNAIQRAQSVTAQNQQLTNKIATIEPKQLELEKLVMQARDQLAVIMALASPKQNNFSQLQDILALLNQAIDPPAK